MWLRARVYVPGVCVKGVHLTLELVQKHMSLKIRILSYLSCLHMKILKITHNRLKWCNCIQSSGSKQSQCDVTINYLLEN